MTRIDLHNVSVDEPLAQLGACAQLHLPSGRACVLSRHHRGSCLFLAPHQIDAQAVPYVA